MKTYCMHLFAYLRKYLSKGKTFRTGIVEISETHILWSVYFFLYFYRFSRLLRRRHVVNTSSNFSCSYHLVVAYRTQWHLRKDKCNCLLISWDCVKANCSFNVVFCFNTTDRKFWSLNVWLFNQSIGPYIFSLSPIWRTSTMWQWLIACDYNVCVL
jgi:hypothetical protein